MSNMIINIYIYIHLLIFIMLFQMSCSSKAPLKQLSFMCCVMPWAPSSTGTPRARIVQHLRTESHIQGDGHEFIPMKIIISMTGWWLSPTPLKNGVKVSWDDDIPNILEKKHVPNHQSDDVCCSGCSFGAQKTCGSQRNTRTKCSTARCSQRCGGLLNLGWWELFGAVVIGSNGKWLESELDNSW